MKTHYNIVLLIVLTIPFCGYEQSFKASPCPDYCKAIPIQDFKKGMEFYFPVVKSLSETNPEWPVYSTTTGIPGHTIIKYMRYSDLAGKTMQLTDTIYFVNENYPEGNYYSFRYTLKDVVTGDSIIYKETLDIRKFNGVFKQKSTTQAGELYTLPGAISIDEVMNANQNLTGKNFYTLFPIRQKKYEPVTITKVEPGTPEAPLQIHFASKDIADSTVDVNICGTNVSGVFKTTFNFDKFFACKIPRDAKTSDDNWESIRQGVPVTGMTTEEVTTALGKPDKINSTETLTGKTLTKTIEYVYATYNIEFENNKAVKVKSSK